MGKTFFDVLVCMLLLALWKKVKGVRSTGEILVATILALKNE